MSLNDFIGKLAKTDLARPNQYQIIMTPPRSMGFTWSRISSVLSMMCHSAEMPGALIDVVPYRIHGITVPRAKGIDYTGMQGIKLSFYMDTELTVKSFFDEWYGTIVNKSNYNMKYDYGSTKYSTDFEIRQLSRAGDRSQYTVKLENAFPIMVQPVRLSYESANEITSLNVTMAFKKWKQIL